MEVQGDTGTHPQQDQQPRQQGFSTHHSGGGDGNICDNELAQNFERMTFQKEEELELERKARQALELTVTELREELDALRNSTKNEGSDSSAQTIEKLRNDLQKAAKLRSGMEEEWSRLSEEFQKKMQSLEEQVSTYEMVLLELNSSCQLSLQEVEKSVKKITVDRNEIQKNIELLEYENDNLQGKYVTHSQMLENEYISLPNDVMELQEMVLRLKEELICVKIGKEQIEGEVKFLRDRVHMEEEEKKKIEESYTAEICELRHQLRDISSHKDPSSSDKNKYERTIADLKSKAMSSEMHLAKIAHLQRQNAQLMKEKEAAEHEAAELTLKITTLRKELTNSEELQRDLISLSKSLQMGLESIRQAETEVRWQHPDDISQCKSCRKSFNESQEKHNCSHCGRIFCMGCVSRTVRRGNRDYHVCDFCHTVLAHDSAPYFSTEPPHSPD